MNSCDLTQKKCRPCEGGVPALSSAESQKLLTGLKGWKLTAHPKLERHFEFKDFAQNMAFVNQVAELSEKEGHHPDFSVHYNKLHIELWTHAIGGLSENDFIVAAKIDSLYEKAR